MVNKVLILLLTFNILLVNAQNSNEITVETSVSDVTVFLSGAQVTRKTQVSFPMGNSTIKFKNLSPYIDAKSVQVKIDGEVMLLSVNHALNHDNVVKINEEAIQFAKQIDDLDETLRIKHIDLYIIAEQISFLQSNREISGSDKGIEYNNLKLTSEYYGQQIAYLLRSQAEIGKEIALLNEEMTAVQRKMATFGNQKQEPTSDLVLTVNTRSAAANVPVELSYYVENASWFPTYDIRAKDISQPIELIYKANVIQNTKEEWNNVSLKISSANPNLGNVAPNLRTYFLNYHTAPPRYDLLNSNLSNTVSGVVVDSEGTPLPGASVTIRGSSIGTSTDINGRYSLAIPAAGGELLVSYIGFKRKTQHINSNIINIMMEEDDMAFEEMVVMGYSARTTTVSEVLQDMTPGVRVSQSSRSSPPVPIVQVERIISAEFEIKTPYTIPSQSKVTVVEMEHYTLDANYEYYAVPKIDRDAFLLAHIVDWEQYNLLEGEANIFFENTFVGKTILDIRHLSDTLSVSLGRDKNVIIRREQVKEHSQTRFLSTRTEVTRNWKTTVRNNKRQPISIVILDQIPVSTLSEIDVMADRLSDGVLNKDTGEVRWKFTLEPSQRKEFDLLYRVRYPRSRRLLVE